MSGNHRPLGEWRNRIANFLIIGSMIVAGVMGSLVIFHVLTSDQIAWVALLIIPLAVGLVMED